MKILLLDGTNLVHRAYYGIRHLTTREGLNTNALYGFLNTILRLLEEEKPDAMCVALDNEHPTFRSELFQDYKAQRSSMDDEFAEQLPILDELLDAMNLPHLTMRGYEADDLLGTLSRIASGAGWETVVVSGDRDMLQLASDSVRVKYVSTAMGRTDTKDYTPSVFEAEYGFAPINLIDLKALMGDASDNIKGVAGVGKITATALIQRFNTIDELYKNLDHADIKPAVRKKLEAGRDDAYLSHNLATIDRNIPLEVRPEDFTLKPYNRPVLVELLTRLEFRSHIEKLGLRDEQPHQLSLTPEKVREKVELTAENCISVAERLKNTLSVAVSPDLSTVAVCDDGRLYIVEQMALGMEVVDRFLAVLFTGDAQIVVHDAKSMYRQLLSRGINPRDLTFDTSLAAYVIDPSTGKYDPAHLAFAYLQRDLDGSVAALAAAVYDLREPLHQKVSDMGMDGLYFELELPLARVIADMERAGIKVDGDMLTAFGDDLTGRVAAAQGRVHQHAGFEFNINSTKMLGELLFEKLGLPPVKKTKSGYSTDIEVLNKLRGKHPIIDDIIEYRQLSKLKSTYCDGLLKVIDADGRIRSNFNMTATATGRLSSTEPNLQNIPVRRDLGSEIRRMFVAESGYSLVDADYSQIELRVLAHIAGDTAMLAAFRNGEDIHTSTAATVFDTVNPTAELRRRAKAVNFGIVYGISAFSLADDLGVTTSEAKQYIKSYLDHYSGIRDYMERVVETAKECGYVTTILNRRRYLPELKSKNFNVRSFGERAAMNAPIQGSAADIIKLAMLQVDRRLKRDCPDARLILQVHDELIVEAPNDKVALVKDILTEEMAGVMSLSVPLVAEAHSGATWYDAKG